MSCRSATSHPCVVWHRVDGSPDIVAASQHSVVESPCTVACLLHVTSRSMLYYHCPTVSMSCTHLMLAIRVYDLSYMHLMCCLLNVLSETMMSLMSGALGSHENASKVESHEADGDARALPHREVGLEP
jgi:hypothetical protein